MRNNIHFMCWWIKKKVFFNWIASTITPCKFFWTRLMPSLSFICSGEHCTLWVCLPAGPPHQVSLHQTPHFTLAFIKVMELWTSFFVFVFREPAVDYKVFIVKWCENRAQMLLTSTSLNKLLQDAEVTSLDSTPSGFHTNVSHQAI